MLEAFSDTSVMPRTQSRPRRFWSDGTKTAWANWLVRCLSLSLLLIERWRKSNDC